jgi:hypothetical protein
LVRLARRSFWLLFGGIWLFVGLVFLAFSVVFAFHEFEYATSGVTTTGVVLTRDIEPAGSNSSTQYRVSYRFTTVQGEVVEGSDAVSVATWERLQERGPIEVRYLPGRPSSNRLALGADSALPLLLLLVGLVIAGAGAVVFVRALRGILEARRLLRLGRATVAAVIRIDETNVTVNGRQQFKVRYSYRDQQDRTHEGDSGYLDWDEAMHWKPGDRVAIRYDPGRPDESLWIGQPEATPQPIKIVDAPPPTSAPPA